MLRGDLGAVAATALAGGVPALRAFGLEVGRPIQPMLASTARRRRGRAGEASARPRSSGSSTARASQVHRDGDDVAVFTRTLDDVTARVPEVVEAALALPVRSVVLDGEAIALRDDGRPHPFQVTGEPLREPPGRAADAAVLRRAAPRRRGPARRAGRRARRAARRGRARGAARPARVADDAEAPAPMLDDALAQGHEGVVVKSLDAPYAAGRRGAGWLKVKPVHTLDLVVLAAEWGHGRRRGWLSNLHLGARDDSEPGVRDARQDLQGPDRRDARVADRGAARARGPTAATGSSTSGPSSSSRSRSTASRRSPRYPGGVALRFARVLRHRPDKRADGGRHARVGAGGGLGRRADERLIPGGLEDRREQAREAGLEVVLAQRVDALGALWRCRMTPASRRILKWCVQVDFVTGTLKLPQLRPSSSPARPRTIRRRTGSLRACRTAASSISSRLGWAMVSGFGISPALRDSCTTIIVHLLAYDEHRTTKDRYDRIADDTPR